MNYKKQKRVPLSMIRLYKLAQNFTTPHSAEYVINIKVRAKIIKEFLEYINEHKNDIL